MSSQLHHYFYCVQTTVLMPSFIFGYSIDPTCEVVISTGFSNCFTMTDIAAPRLVQLMCCLLAVSGT